MTKTETKNETIEMFFDCSYGYLNNLVRHYKDNGVLFTEQGKMRLAHIVGHIAGLFHGNQKDMAIAMAESIDSQLGRIAYNGRQLELPLTLLDPDADPADTVIVKAPSAKVILGDDGTFGGFSVGWYRAIAPATYEATVREARKIKDESPDKEFNKIKAEYYSTADLARHMLNITERVDRYSQYSDELTEHKYVTDHGSVEIYYTFSHPGGLMYHGPGGGENFSVTLESNALWSVHT